MFYLSGTEGRNIHSVLLIIFQDICYFFVRRFHAVFMTLIFQNGINRQNPLGTILDA